MLAMLPQQNPEKCVVRLLGNYQIVCAQPKLEFICVSLISCCPK